MHKRPKKSSLDSLTKKLMEVGGEKNDNRPSKPTEDSKQMLPKSYEKTQAAKLGGF